MMVREAYNGMSQMQYVSRYGWPDTTTHRQIRSAERTVAKGAGITAGLFVGFSGHPILAAGVGEFVNYTVNRAFSEVNHRYGW